MKALLPLVLFLSLVSAAVAAQQELTRDFVYELYEYCLEEYDSIEKNTNAEVLSCINDDLHYHEMPTFKTLEMVKIFMASQLDASKTQSTEG